MGDDDPYWKFGVWRAVKEREEGKRTTRDEAVESLLRFHRVASQCPEGSKGWFTLLTDAQRYYEFHLKRGAGRPKRARDLDDYAIAYMLAMGYITGETSANKLANKAIEADQVPDLGGTEESRVARIVAKYTAYKCNPRPLNLDGGPDEKAWIRRSHWRLLKHMAWHHAMEEPQLVLEHARDVREFLSSDKPAIEQEFDDLLPSSSSPSEIGGVMTLPTFSPRSITAHPRGCHLEQSWLLLAWRH